MKKIKTGIVNNTTSNQEIIQDILETQCAGVDVIWNVNNLEEAAKMIAEKKVDLLFIDIEKSANDYMEFVEKTIVGEPQVVFVAASHEHALRAIKMEALDYILKPIDTMDVINVIDKLRSQDKFGELTNIFKNSRGTAKCSKIIVSVNEGYDIVDINDIVHIEALDSYTKLKLVNNVSYVTSRSLKDFEELLCDKGFSRIHKSFLINLSHMMKIVKGVSSAVVMNNGTTIPVSARKKDTFFTELRGVVSF
ncbi:MAG TPA: LytTR family DNA-binding domain-containing protein [Flavipsychrobacter sp.]|nr:LytTR family DNA-binding domain-containing protein [Flavipsychrobacter sp.]